jgi:hypothetical protein
MSLQAAEVAADELSAPAICADPGLASVKGRSWFGPSRDGGFEDVIQT